MSRSHEKKIDRHVGVAVDDFSPKSHEIEIESPNVNVLKKVQAPR